MAVIEVTFASAALHRQVSYQAVVPEQGQRPREGFPSLYLLHGVTGSRLNWTLNTSVARWASEHQVALIMPDGANSFYVDQEAALEWYGQYVGDELVAATRWLLPLSSRREDTAIGGLSMGGYGAIRNGFKYAPTFGAVIALSSALVTYGAPEAPVEAEWPFRRRGYLESVFGPLSRLPGSDKDPEALARERAASGPLPRLYLACGTEDSLLAVNQRFHRTLQALDIDHTYVEESGGHDWGFWDRQIAEALVCLTGPKRPQE